MPDESPQRPTAERDFRFGEWLVQPNLDRASRDGTVVHLRPQLTNLLVLLARHAGQPVRRELILDEVWACQYVADSALSRCIAEIRQIFQDDAREPRLVETIPKRGYRVVAPVVYLEARRTSQCQMVPSASTDAEPDPPVTGAHSPALATCPAQAAVSPECPAGADQVREEAATGAKRLPSRARWAAVGAGVVAGMAAGAALIFGAASRSGGTALPEPATVLLESMTNATGDRVFDNALELAVAVALEQAPYLHVLPRDAVRSALVRMGRSPDEPVVGALALDVCRREGAPVLLAGSIAQLGSRYSIGLEALACGTGESLGRALGEADRKEDVLAALEDAAARIRIKLGQSQASLRDSGAPLVRATTPSLEALRALSLGDDNRDHARLGEALALYRQATEIDADFALAWARRGAAARSLSLWAESVPAFRRAYDLRERVSQPERFYIEGHYFRLVEGNPDRAIEAYRAWNRMYPGSAVPPTNLASVLSGVLGEYDAALAEAREAVRLAPHSSVAYSNLIGACLGSSRIADARQALAEAATRQVDDGLIHRHRVNLALFDGDRTALERESRWAAADPAAALLTVRLRALAAMAGGRLREGRRLWLEAVGGVTATGSAQRIAALRLQQASAEALLGDARAARAAVRAGLAVERGAATLAGSAVVFALLGDTTRARTLTGEAARLTAPEVSARQVFLPVAQALVGAGQGHMDEAMRLLQPVARFERGSDFGLVPLAVRAMVQQSARRHSEAAAAFETVVRLRAVDPSSPWVAYARLGLARALRDSGDRVNSLAAYNAFLNAWSNADTDAPLLKTALRERAALTGR